MPWFKIDDSAHNHPKFRMAGNAALGLWVRCGSYAAEHLTEGVVSGGLARQYGTPAQAAKLVKAGMWHEYGHGCARCPQPDPGDYVMHDFFEGGRNTTRAQVEAARTAAAERQRRHRAKETGDDFAAESDAKWTRNGRETEPDQQRNGTRFEGSAAGQEGLSQRYDRESVTPPQANYQASTSVGGTSDRKLDAREPIPDWALPLVHRVHAAGLPGLRWNLPASDWFVVHSLMGAKGVEAMADHAARSSQSSAKPVVSARYFMNGWKDLPDRPPNGTPVLRAVPGRSTTGDRVAQAQALAEQYGGEAKSLAEIVRRTGRDPKTIPGELA